MDAVERGEIQKESDKAGPKVLNAVIYRVQIRCVPEHVHLSERVGGGQQKYDTEYVIHVDHAEFGHFDGLGSEFHVEHVSAGGDAVHGHPKETNESDFHVVPGGGNGTRKHDPKGDVNQSFRPCSETNVVSGGGEDVGNVLEDGNHGYRVELQRRHAGEEHETEKDIDGSPGLGHGPGQGRVFHPAGFAADLDAHDRRDGLKDNEENVQVTLVQVPVTTGETLIDQNHTDTAKAVEGAGCDGLDVAGGHETTPVFDDGIVVGRRVRRRIVGTVGVITVLVVYERLGQFHIHHFLLGRRHRRGTNFGGIGLGKSNDGTGNVIRFGLLL